MLYLLGGVIQLLQVKLGRPLHYAICQLHENELPLRHLFSKLDGSTSGPNSFSGPIGNAIKDNVHHLDIINFARIIERVNKLSEEIINSLSEDQRYLYKISRGIMAGRLPDQMITSAPGALNHARYIFVIRINNIYYCK